MQKDYDTTPLELFIPRQFQHRFHDEGVFESSRKKFETHFRASGKEVSAVDDYVRERNNEAEDKG